MSDSEVSKLRSWPSIGSWTTRYSIDEGNENKTFLQRVIISILMNNNFGRCG